MKHLLNAMFLLSLLPGLAKAQLKKISKDHDFAVHTYFHVSPESPDGAHIVYTSFPDGPTTAAKGRAEIYVCDREAENHQKIGEVKEVEFHKGAFARWIDNEWVAYSDEEKVYIVNITNGQQKVFKGAIDNYSPVAEKFLFYTTPRSKSGLEPGIYTLDVHTGTIKLLVRIAYMKKFAPLGEMAYDPQVWRFAHSYWSPNAKKIAFAVFNQDPHYEAFVFTANADGSEIKLFGPKPMHWTFYDTTSFFGHDDKKDKKDQFMRRWDLEGNIVEELSGPGCHGTVSPDGKWIVTESWYNSEPVQIYLYKRGATKPHTTLATMQGNWQYKTHVHPAFSPNGRRVYFNYNAQGSKGSQVYCYELGQ